jgi:hypothetical protein
MVKNPKAFLGWFIHLFSNIQELGIQSRTRQTRPDPHGLYLSLRETDNSNVSNSKEGWVGGHSGVCFMRSV